MNSQLLKKIAIFTVGALTGAGFGYLVSSKLFEQIDETNDPAPTGFEWVPVEETVQQETEETPELLNIVKEEPLKNKKNVAKKKIDYSGIKTSKLDKNKKKVNEVAKEMLGSDAVEEIDTTKPHVISLDAYIAGDENGEYEQVGLSYYEDDDVVCDEDNNVVSNVEELIDGEGLLKFGEQSMDPDIVYIRNPQLKKNFEVIRFHTSYTKAVLGIEETKEDKKPRKSRKVNDDHANEDE